MSTIKNEVMAAPATPTPALLLERAIDKGVDMDQLQKLMDLQERWERKEAKKSFLDSLARFQSIVPNLRKSKTANVKSDKGSFSYKYADLGSITAGIKDALRECGLSYRWEFEEVNGKMKVTCIVSHRDGHSETTAMESGLDTSGAKNAIQQRGSTHTYLQRYTLIGALGLSTADEDNDAKGVRSTKAKFEPSEPGPSDEDYLEDWKMVVSNIHNRTQLTKLYLDNKKVVDGDPQIKALLKARESDLKKLDNPKTSLP